jgi:hypothetical protein
VGRARVTFDTTLEVVPSDRVLSHLHRYDPTRPVIRESSRTMPAEVGPLRGICVREAMTDARDSASTKMGFSR